MNISRRKLIRESFDRSKLLEPGYRYGYNEVEDCINDNDPDWEGVINIEEGNMGLGEFIIYLRKPNVWLHTWERPLNDWSSSQDIEYFDTFDDIPKELLDGEDDYYDYDDDDV